MAKKSFFVGILCMVLVFGFSVVGCDDDKDNPNYLPTALYISGIPESLYGESVRIRIGNSKGNYGAMQIDAGNVGTIQNTKIGGTLYVDTNYSTTAYYGSGNRWIDIDIGNNRYVSKSIKNVSGETVVSFTEFEQVSFL
jgi:hypothetical protein